MDARLETILKNLPDKEPHSRLEPYRELITEMRKQGRSYREIARVLKSACGIKAGSSTVNDFVLAQSKSAMNRQSTRLGHRRANRNTKEVIGTISRYRDVQGTIRHSNDVESIVSAIKELKEQPPRRSERKTLFEYNPEEPLRLHPKNKPKE